MSTQGGRVLPGTGVPGRAAPTRRIRSTITGLVMFLVLTVPGMPAAVRADGEVGSITGVVSGPDAAPVAGAIVMACTNACAPEVTTAADGTYTIAGLPYGTYRVGVTDITGKNPSGWVSATGLAPSRTGAQAFEVAATPVRVDVHLPVAHALSGSVTAAEGGAGIAGVVVAACTTADVASRQGLAACGVVVTAADGTYAMALLPETYAVFFLDPTGTHADGYYSKSGFAFGWSASTPVVMGAADRTGVSVALPAGYVVGGTVRDAAGAPAEGVKVSVCMKTVVDACSTAATEASGSYTVQGLPSGTYYLAFVDETGTYPTGFLGESGFVTSFADARYLTVGASGLSGIDATLPQGHLVSGTVIVPGSGQVDATVDVCTGGLCVAVVDTQEDGSYSLNLAPGTYELHVSAFSATYLSGYYAKTGLANWMHASPVTIGSGDRSGLDIALRRVAVGLHAGTGHTGTWVAGRTLAVKAGTYVTARFALGKGFAGTKVQVLRSVKSSTGTWSTPKRIATTVVAADGYAYYSTRVSGWVKFQAVVTDAVVPDVQVTSPEAVAEGK